MADQQPTKVVLWWNGELWGARAKHGNNRGYVYVESLAELPAAAVEAVRKAGGATPVILQIQHPPLVHKLLPEIEDGEARAAELRRELRNLELHIDQLRQQAFKSLRRANLRPEDAIHLLSNGFTIEAPASEQPPE